MEPINNRIVISDTTAITYLSKIQAIDLLKALFKEIYIPQAVFNELTRHGDHIPGSIEVKTFPWIKTEKVKNVSQILSKFKKELDPGETEAIALAIEKNANLLIIDESDGRREAERHGIKITGMLGILLKAKEKNIICNVKPFLDKIKFSTNFNMTFELYNAILEIAGESVNQKKDVGP